MACSPLRRAVHAETCDRRSSNRRSTLQIALVVVNAEVVIPIVSAWIVEQDNGSGERILVVDRACLTDVAGAAGERQVVVRILTLAYERNNVLDLKWEVEHGLGSMAVLAAMSRAQGDGRVMRIQSARSRNIAARRF